MYCMCMLVCFCMCSNENRKCVAERQQEVMLYLLSFSSFNHLQSPLVHSTTSLCRWWEQTLWLVIAFLTKKHPWNTHELMRWLYTADRTICCASVAHWAGKSRILLLLQVWHHSKIGECLWSQHWLCDIAFDIIIGCEVNCDITIVCVTSLVKS